MLKPIFKPLTTVICLLVLTIANASESKPKPPSEIPKSFMQKLSIMQGNWQLEVSMTNDSGKTWQTLPAQQVTIDFTHNNLVLEEKPLNAQPGSFSMLTYLSYDQYRKVFRKAAIDDVWGIMDLYQGQIKNKQLVLDNLDAGTFFPVGPNTWRGFRLTVDLFKQKENSSSYRLMTIDKTDDKGKTWQPAFKAKYLKL